MANEEKSLRLRFEVTGNGAVVVKDLSGQVKNLSLNMRQAEVVAKKYGTTVSNLTGKTFKTTGAEYQKMSGQLGDLSRSTGSATSAALELGRVVSDMPYGIRGVANNLSQFASNMLFASTSIDKATGKSIGFLGAIGQLKNALKGPLGLLLLIQGVIAAFDYFSASTFGAKKEVDDLNKSIDEQLTKFQLLTTFLTQKDMKSIDEIMGTSGFQENLKIINNEKFICTKFISRTNIGIIHFVIRATEIEPQTCRMVARERKLEYLLAIRNGRLGKCCLPLKM